MTRTKIILPKKIRKILHKGLDKITNPYGYSIFGYDYTEDSTCLSRIFALVAAIIYFYKVIQGRLGIKYLRPFPINILKELLKLGIPTAGENISYNFSQLVLQALINTMGMVAINARIYANMMCTFTYMFAYSAAIATQIIVGHSVWRKRLRLCI